MSELSPESRARMERLIAERAGRGVSPLDSACAKGIEIGFVAAHVEAEERQRALIEALKRADTLLMAANGALGRAIAHQDDPDATALPDALQDVKARLSAVSDTTLTALFEAGALAVSSTENEEEQK